MLEAGRRTREITDPRLGMTSAKNKGRPKAPFPRCKVKLSSVLVLLGISIPDLFIAVRLDVGLALSELLLGIAHRVFGLAEGLLHFALGLFAHALQLLFFAASDFTKFLLGLAGDVFHF